MTSDPLEQKERPSHYPLGEFDAKKWADEFMRLWGWRPSEIDGDLMLSWFASAIVTGHDHAIHKERARAEAAEAACARMREALMRWWNPDSAMRPRHEPNCGECVGCLTELALSTDAGSAAAEVLRAAKAFVEHYQKHPWPFERSGDLGLKLSAAVERMEGK